MPAPKTFPRMTSAPALVDALAWYPQDWPGLDKMQYQARDEIVSLRSIDLDHPGMIGVPRSLAPPAAPAQDKRSIGNVEFEAKFISPLRTEQEPFVEGVFTTLENEQGCIGEAPTGFGKTTTGCWLIAKIGRPTCIVIPKGDLDWKPELLRHTDIPENRIDTWSGQKLPDPNAWVVVAMLQSIYRAGVYPAEVYNRFACVIFDEVHRLGAQEFSAAIRKFPAMFRLGLSATADRRDGKMDLIHSHVGWKHVVGFTDADQPNYFVLKSSWLEPFNKAGKRIPFDPGSTDAAKRSLIKDQIRNAQIAAALYRAHKAGRRIIVFIEQIAHGEILLKATRAMGVPASALIQYNGQIKGDDQVKAKACPPGTILFATYKFTAEGTNIPLLDTAVFAHPIYDPRQAVGRITRKPPDGFTKPKPVVIDVWDDQSPTLRRIAAARWEYMRKLGATWKGEFS